MQLPTIKAVTASSRTAPSERQQSSHNSATPKEPLGTLWLSRFEVVSEDGNEIVYRAVDPETGMVLAEVPSEEVRRVAERLQQLMAEGKIE